MIRCLPRGLCSWDFLLDDEDHHASLEFHWFTEQGAITADGLAFEVRKHGMFSGYWSLETDGRAVASAEKSNAFTRTFEIQAPHDALRLRAESALSRSFRLERSGDTIATIRPDHLFTRRATIEPLAKGWDFPTVAFAFWLVVMTWRREGASHSGAAAGGMG